MSDRFASALPDVRCYPQAEKTTACASVVVIREAGA